MNEEEEKEVAQDNNNEVDLTLPAISPQEEEQEIEEPSKPPIDLFKAIFCDEEENQESVDEEVASESTIQNQTNSKNNGAV